jgi:hypothetical protein
MGSPIQEPTPVVGVKKPTTGLILGFLWSDCSLTSPCYNKPFLFLPYCEICLKINLNKVKGILSMKSFHQLIQEAMLPSSPPPMGGGGGGPAGKLPPSSPPPMGGGGGGGGPPPMMPPPSMMSSPPPSSPPPMGGGGMGPDPTGTPPTPTIHGDTVWDVLLNYFNKIDGINNDSNADNNKEDHEMKNQDQKTQPQQQSQ